MKYRAFEVEVAVQTPSNGVRGGRDSEQRLKWFEIREETVEWGVTPLMRAKRAVEKWPCKVGEMNVLCKKRKQQSKHVSQVTKSKDPSEPARRQSK